VVIVAKIKRAFSHEHSAISQAFELWNRKGASYTYSEEDFSANQPRYQRGRSHQRPHKFETNSLVLRLGCAMSLKRGHMLRYLLEALKGQTSYNVRSFLCPSHCSPSSISSSQHRVFQRLLRAFTCQPQWLPVQITTIMARNTKHRDSKHQSRKSTSIGIRGHAVSVFIIQSLVI
jgi:hypothetical protein